MTTVKVISEAAKSDKEWKQGDLLIQKGKNGIVMFSRYASDDKQIFEGTVMKDFDSIYNTGYQSTVFDSDFFTRWYGRIIIDSVRES